MPSIPSPTKLFDAIEASDDRLEEQREKRRENYQEFAGRYAYRDDGKSRPLNLIAKGVHTFVPYMASRSPEHDVTAEAFILKGEADKLSLALTQLSRRLRRVHKSRRMLMDAFMGPFSVRMVGSRTSSEIVTVRGKDFPRGASYDQPIDLDDLILDPAARIREEAEIMGHYYRVRRDHTLESEIFRGKEHIIERLPSLSDGRSGTRRQERHEDLSRQFSGHNDDDYELFDYIELIDVLLMDEVQPLILTLPAHEDYREYLRIKPFQGPCTGRYHFLEFYSIPNQLFGIAPVAWWREQSETFYALINKAVREILRMKNVLVGNRGQEDDLDAIRDAEDSDVLLLDDVQGAQNLTVGAQIPDLTPMAELFLGMFQTQAHNPDLLSGQAATTDKATIYQGQQQGAMKIVQDMQFIHDGHEEEVSEHLGWELMHDPLIRMPLYKRMKGGEWIEVEYSYDQREGQWGQFQFRMKPRSMQYRDQMQRTAAVVQVMDIVFKAAEVAMGTGGMLNPVAVAEIIARELDVEELDQIINDPMYKMMQAQLYSAVPMDGQGQPGAPGVSPQFAQQGMQGYGGGMGGMGGANPAGPRLPTAGARPMLGPGAGGPPMGGAPATRPPAARPGPASPAQNGRPQRAARPMSAPPKGRKPQPQGARR